jgi:hypothetical protein
MMRSKDLLGFTVNSPGFGYKVMANNKEYGVYFQIGNWNTSLKITKVLRIQRRL